MTSSRHTAPVATPRTGAASPGFPSRRAVPAYASTGQARRSSTTRRRPALSCGLESEAPVEPPAAVQCEGFGDVEPGNPTGHRLPFALSGDTLGPSGDTHGGERVERCGAGTASRGPWGEGGR